MGDPSGTPIAQDYVMNGALERVPDLGRYIVDSAFDGPFNNFEQFSKWAKNRKDPVDNKTFNEYIGFTAPSIQKTSFNVDYSALSTALSAHLGKEVLAVKAEFGEEVEDGIIKKYILQEYGNNIKVSNAPFSYILDTEQEVDDEEEDEDVVEPDPTYYIVTVTGYGTFDLMLDTMMEEQATEDSFFVIEYNYARTITERSDTDSGSPNISEGYDTTFTDDPLTPTYVWETPPVTPISLDPEEYISVDPDWFSDLESGSNTDKILKILLDNSETETPVTVVETINIDVSRKVEIFEIELGLPDSEGIVPISLGQLENEATSVLSKTVNVINKEDSFVDSGDYLTFQDENGNPLAPENYYRNQLERDISMVPSIGSSSVDVPVSIEIIYDQEGIPLKAVVTTDTVPVNKLNLTWDITDRDYSISGAEVLVDTPTGIIIPSNIKNIIQESSSSYSTAAALPPILITKNGELNEVAGYERKVKRGAVYCYPVNYRMMKKQFKDMLEDPDSDFLRQGNANFAHYNFGSLIDTKSQLGTKYIIAWLKNNFDVVDMQALISGNATKLNTYRNLHNNWIYQNKAVNGVYLNPGPLTRTPIPKPPELELPSRMSMRLKVKEAYNFNMLISCAGVASEIKTGKFTASAHIGQVGRKNVSSIQVMTSTFTLGGTGVPQGLYRTVTRVEWYTQLTENTYEVITSMDLKYSSRVHSERLKEAHASECIEKVNDDEFSHSFFIPFQPDAVKGLSLLDRNQMFRDNRLIVSNIYIKKRVKRGWYRAAVKIGTFVLAASFGPLGLTLYAGYQVYKVNKGRQSWGEALMAASGLEALGLTVDLVMGEYYAVFAKIFGSRLGKIIADIVYIIVSIILTIVTLGGYGAVMASAQLMARLAAEIIISLAIYAYNAYLESKHDRIERKLEVDRNQYIDYLDELDDLGVMDSNGQMTTVGAIPMIYESPDQFFSRTLMGSEEFVDTLFSAVYANEEKALTLEK